MINLVENRGISGTLRVDNKKSDMYRESEKNIELKKKLAEVKAELKKEQDKAEILSNMLELAKVNPSELANIIDGLPPKD
jgi:H2-forming N5,N10-methylenetetrahydromethanopterin dehydrogenase-like enzyme